MTNLSADDVAIALRVHLKDWKEAASEGVEGSRIGAGAVLGVIRQIADLLPEADREVFIIKSGGQLP